MCILQALKKPECFLLGSLHLTLEHHRRSLERKLLASKDQAKLGTTRCTIIKFLALGIFIFYWAEIKTLLKGTFKWTDG